MYSEGLFWGCRWVGLRVTVGVREVVGWNEDRDKEFRADEEPEEINKDRFAMVSGGGIGRLSEGNI